MVRSGYEPGLIQDAGGETGCDFNDVQVAEGFLYGWQDRAESIPNQVDSRVEVVGNDVNYQHDDNTGSADYKLVSHKGDQMCKFPPQDFRYYMKDSVSGE